MKEGTVKFFNDEKGYGFIKPSNGGNDDFIHHTVVTNCGIANLLKGDKVEYSTGPDNKGKVSVVEISIVG